MKIRLWDETRRLFLVAAAGAALTALPVSAQYDSGSSRNAERTATGGTGDYSSSADYNGGRNFGWIGLLGLVGLVGLRGAARHNYDDYRTRPGPA